MPEYSKRYRRTFIKTGLRYDYYSSRRKTFGGNLVITNLFTGEIIEAGYAIIPDEALPESRPPHETESQ